MPGGIWKADTETKQDLAPEQMDKMDYFVFAPYLHRTRSFRFDFPSAIRLVCLKFLRWIIAGSGPRASLKVCQPDRMRS